MGDDGAEMFRAIRNYAVGRATKNTGEIAMEHASEYYIIQFFNQYVGDIELSLCDATLKAVQTARRRINPTASPLSTAAKEQIAAICAAYARKLHVADYYSSLDAGSMCLRRNINAAMVSVYRHQE
jgi:hypothetical protein